MNRRTILSSLGVLSGSLAGCSQLGMLENPGTTEDPDSTDQVQRPIREDLSRGLIAYTASGEYGVIDPSGNRTPVQDAITAVDDIAGGGGAIFLPPGEVSDAGPLHSLSHKAVVGVAAGRGPYDDPKQNGSTVTIDGGGDGIQIGTEGSGGFHDGSWCWLHNFTLNAHDHSDGRAAIRFNGDHHVPDFNMGNMRFTEWTNTKANNNPGIFSFQKNQCFRSQWQKIVFHSTSGPGIYADGGKPYGVHVGHFQNSPRNDSVALETRNSAVFSFDMFMQGRSGKRAVTGYLNSNGAIVISNCIVEPSAWMTHGTEAFNLHGPGQFWLGAVRVHNNGGYDQIYRLGKDNGNNRLPKPILTDKTAVKSNTLNVTSSPKEASYYFGPSKDIQNDANSNTGLIIPFEDLSIDLGVA